MSTPKNPWLPYPAEVPGVRSRVFCFASAGGSASEYTSWKGDLTGGVEFCAVELPGRGSRLREKPVRKMEALIPAVIDGIRGRLDLPFALFGRGMGALIAFELARALRGESSPLQLLVSGHRAPRLRASEPPIHALPEPAFRDALRERTEIPPEVLDHPADGDRLAEDPRRFRAVGNVRASVRSAAGDPAARLRRVRRQGVARGAGRVARAHRRHVRAPRGRRSAAGSATRSWRRCRAGKAPQVWLSPRQPSGACRPRPLL